MEVATIKLNTTREERDNFLANYKDPIVYTNYVEDLAEDCNVLEEELARVRYDLDMAQGELQCQMAANDKLREELESAKRLLHRIRVDLKPTPPRIRPETIVSMIDEHAARFGGRE